MGDVGAPELLIILVVVLLVFGGAKLPELARSLGKAKNEFQKGVDEGMPDAGDDHHVSAATTEATEPIDVAPAIGAPPIAAIPDAVPERAAPPAGAPPDDAGTKT